ncbi:dolichol kinase [Diatrype stigma]|uniref:dolichol kinase n=1 Tax=Diatrype stigma TaxID=117547 RepID=A0AAN9YP45_9PEZI
MSLLYPLHVNLYHTLHTLTTTSLLPAELQLLSITLIDVLLLSSSPQAIILKAGLWVGGLDILVLCSRVILWGIALARVPKWRFKRTSSLSKSRLTSFLNIISWRRVRHDIFHVPLDSSSYSSNDGLDDQDDSDDPAKFRPSKGGLRINTTNFDGPDGAEGQNQGSQAVDATKRLQFNTQDSNGTSPPRRRHTLPSGPGHPRKSHAHTPSGRRKRSASSSVRAFFSLTQEEATLRKWQYAAYVYICIGAALFAPIPSLGILQVVKTQALHGNDAIGWALGYMLGDLPAFRWQVVSHNLERWICLPERTDETTSGPSSLGWVADLRHSYLGEANTRLLMCGYCIAVIAVGLTIVFRLSPFYEVDTRRKVFHFMMVAMFLPLTYIDPAFVALALAIVLVLFLLLDLLRASQLPPLSKPLASFLAPYVDGRDLRGPVVVSHIFLLIGCAIPLWLSLGALPRTASVGEGENDFTMDGWELPSREVAMVSGVVCVGLGDAAASLIGRRYGHRKWLWGGGKSLEGSLAFALAVFAGLAAAHLWLRAGGWSSPADTNASAYAGEGATLVKAGVCATVASLTEAVLTGGNDNVIVPVVLWTCVKSLGV